MGRLIKYLLILVAGVIGIFAIAAIGLLLFFDPNDYRDEISTAVNEQTGRELTIAGDISLSVFPWFALELGETSLGNAEGFSADEFLSIDSARLSVQIMPLITRQEITVGTASLEGLNVNLEVAADGTNNWDDLAESGDAQSTASVEVEGSGSATLDVESISVTGAQLSYDDRQAGARYRISDLSFETGRIAAESPVDIAAGFSFAAEPDGIDGRIDMRGTATIRDELTKLSMAGLNVAGTLNGIVDGPADFNFDSRAVHIDTSAETIDAGEMDLTVLNVAMAADVEPFSYAGTPQPTANLRVAAFSLKELMSQLGIEPPATADDNAMQRVSFSANAKVGEDAIALNAVTLELDDSTMTGELSLPMTASGALGFDLEVDAIVVDGYMAPPVEGVVANDEQTADVEIPADLIRTLNVDGSFRINKAYLTGMEFSNLELGVKSSGGKLRLHPLAADFYGGGYSGDVNIDASEDVPMVSANERISDVDVGAMMKALYDVENITGTVNGQFVLAGSGQTLSAIQQDLDGRMVVELLDGAWEGTDVWHQLRSARALFRREPAPEPKMPARTEFTSVRATGLVTDGIFTNDDFLAELPFLQLNGAGMVDLNTTEIDYGLQVRVLDRPEFMTDASEEELADFTETVVPIKISGLLASPKVAPDMEGIFRERVEEAIEEQKDALRDEIFNRLLGSDGEEGETSEEDGEEDLEEKLKKDLLDKLFND